MPLKYVIRLKNCNVTCEQGMKCRLYCVYVVTPKIVLSQTHSPNDPDTFGI